MYFGSFYCNAQYIYLYATSKTEKVAEPVFVIHVFWRSKAALDYKIKSPLLCNFKIYCFEFIRQPLQHKQGQNKKNKHWDFVLQLNDTPDHMFVDFNLGEDHSIWNHVWLWF